MTGRDFREIEAGLNSSEDGTLKFHFVPSLKKLALAKVASLLWMSQSTQQEIVNLFRSGSEPDDEFPKKRREIKNNIIDKVSELCLPKAISIELKETALPISINIFDWIHYHDRFTLKFYFKNSKYSAADLISHIIWTDRGKIDLAKTAKNILANQGNGLSDDQKYKMACTYCLEDEIAILASKVVNQDYLRSIDIDIFPMVYYWTTYIIGDDNNINIHEYIIQLLLTHAYIVPDEIYMSVWNKLSEQERAKITPSLVKFGGQDSLYFMLSNLDYLQQQDIFKNYSGHILCSILNDLFWEEYFLPVALHVLKIMRPKCYGSVLSQTVAKIYKGEKFKDYFVILWQRSSRHLKDYIFNNMMFSFLCDCFSWEKDLDIIDLMFKDASNAQQRKKIIFDEDCIEKCSDFIQNGEWHFLELFMKYTLSSEEDIIQFKETLTRLKGGEIAFGYLSDEAYDDIKTFMDWAFKSKEEGDHFRQTLVRDSRYMMRSIMENPKKTFTKVENYLTWCANSDLELINKFKSEIPIHQPHLIERLIEEGQCQLLDQLLNWCYLGNQQRIAQFKCSIANYDDMHVDDDDHLHE